MAKIHPQWKIPPANRAKAIYMAWVASFIAFVISFVLLSTSILVQIATPHHGGEVASIALAVISAVLAILAIVLVGSMRILCSRDKVTKSYYELLEDIFNSKHFWKRGYTTISVISFLATYISLPLAFIALGMAYGQANATAALVVSIVSITITAFTVAIFLVPVIFLAVKNFFLFHFHGTQPIYERWDHNSMMTDVLIGLKECEEEVRDTVAEWLVRVNRLTQEVLLSILIMEKFAHHRTWPKGTPTPIEHFKELTGVNLDSPFWHHWKKGAMHNLADKISRNAKINLHYLNKEVHERVECGIRDVCHVNTAELLREIEVRDPEIYHLFTRLESRHFTHGVNPFDCIILWNCVQNRRFAELLWRYIWRYGRSYNAAVFLLQNICGIDVTNRFWNSWRKHTARRYFEQKRLARGGVQNEQQN